MKVNALYILIVDDDSAVRKSIIATLKNLQGVTLLEAESGQEALGLLATHRNNIGVIITDHDMPGMSGKRLIGNAKAQFPKIRSILISGGLQQEDVDKMFGPTKPTYFLAKPFCMSVLRILTISLVTNFVTGMQPPK